MCQQCQVIFEQEVGVYCTCCDPQKRKLHIFSVNLTRSLAVYQTAQLCSLFQTAFHLRLAWAAGVVTGFHVDKHTLKITQLWSSVYASPGVEVLALAARNPAEHVYSQAKVSNTQALAHACMTVSLLVSHKV